MGLDLETNNTIVCASFGLVLSCVPPAFKQCLQLLGNIGPLVM